MKFLEAMLQSKDFATLDCNTLPRIQSILNKIAAIPGSRFTLHMMCSMPFPINGMLSWNRKHECNLYQISSHSNLWNKEPSNQSSNASEFSTRIIFQTTTITNVDIFEIHRVDIFDATIDIGVHNWLYSAFFIDKVFWWPSYRSIRIVNISSDFTFSVIIRLGFSIMIFMVIWFRHRLNQSHQSLPHSFQVKSDWKNRK